MAYLSYKIVEGTPDGSFTISSVFLLFKIVQYRTAIPSEASDTEK